MRPIISYEEVEEKMTEQSVLFVDVRSPKEHKKATIPGAINLPVLLDDDRVEVGTLYDAGKVEAAKQYGVKSLSPRLPEMFQFYQTYSRQYDSVVIFCSRGGYRSNSIFSLLKSLGMNVSRLEGGYKSYRRNVTQQLPELIKKVQFVTLYGTTGNGKTAILEELKEKGANVLDLERCANHRGSLLGSVGLNEPNSQKMFESLLFDAAKEWSEPFIVFTEGESKRIGNVILPNVIVEAMREGINIRINADMDYRLKQLKQDYLTIQKDEEILDGLEQLKRYVNNDRIEKYKKQVESKDYDSVIEELLLKYYDPRYNHTKKTYAAEFKNEQPAETAAQILEWLKKEQLVNEKNKK